MKIQHITLNGNTNKFKNKDITETRFNGFSHFNEFDINILDLTDKSIWTNNDRYTTYVNCQKDFESISKIIKEIYYENTSKALVILPQNSSFRYDRKSANEYYKHIDLKDMVEALSGGVLNPLLVYSIGLKYAKSKTIIDGEEFNSDFLIIDTDNQRQKLSNKSGIVSTNDKNCCYTTLEILNNEQLELFLKRIGWIKENKENVPDWMEDVTMFDDVIQREKIKIAEQEIKDQEAKITAANEKLIENERYKSILYTQGDELADVVKDMIEQLFNIDLSEFTDVKKEDFAFKLDDKFVIGEVKGVTSQVTTQHLSQLDNHLTSFSEKNSVSEDDVIRLLIIDSQRKIPVAERVPVDQQQIDKAENKYGSLIIETKEFLKMFEKFKSGDLNREACIDLINQKGILKID